MERRVEITIERATGPRLTMADPTSKGELTAYTAGRATARVARAAVATRQRKIVAFIAIYFAVWLSAVYLASIFAFVQTVGPWTVGVDGFTVPQTTTKSTGTCASGDSDGTCIFYVDPATGVDDATNCKGYDPPVTSTPATKCATFQYALHDAIRGAKPDWLLLKRGTTHAITAQTLLDNKRWGQDATKPWLISAYPLAPSVSGDKPVVDLSGSSSGTLVLQQSFSMQGAIIGIKFINSSWDPSSPNYWVSPKGGDIFRLLGQINFLLLEDNEFVYTVGGIQIGPGTATQNDKIYVRRNLFRNDARPALGFLHGGRYGNMLVEENFFYKDWTNVNAAGSTVSITSASPAVITFAHDTATAPENGGIPPFGIFGAAPLIGLSGSLPSGLTATTKNCDEGQCYYLCNISGATANLSTSSSCASVLNTSGVACVAACTAKWVDSNANIFSHNDYFDLGWDESSTALATGNGLVWRNNITAYASATGLQTRPGGMVYNNLFVRNPIQITLGAWPSDVGYNVMLEAYDMQKAISAAKYGWGIEITNYRCAAPALGVCTSARVADPPSPGVSGSRVYSNILAKSLSSGGNGNGFIFDGATTYNAGVGEHLAATTGITVDSNVICDHPTVTNKPYNDAGTGNTISTTNRPNPSTSNVDTTCSALSLTPASVADYYVSIGGPGGSTTDDFLNAAMAKWNKLSWDDRYMAKAVNAYIRPTYGLTNPPDTRTVRMTVN